MEALISTLTLIAAVGFATVAALLVRVCNRLDVLIAQGSKRRQWIREEHQQ